MRSCPRVPNVLAVHNATLKPLSSARQFVYPPAIMLKQFSVFAVVCVAGLQLASCSSRTSAATQTTPVAFAPEKSDAKAIELVDAMVAKLGGAPAWDTVKQIQFELKYMNDGKPKGWFNHSWDRWNGRHRMETIDLLTVAKAEAEGNPSLIKSLVVMYNLFERNRGHVAYGGVEAPSDEKKKRIAEAYKRWQDDAYKISFLYKLKDPGVVLKYKDKVKDQSGVCAPACDVIEVSFSDGVGTDKYFVNINETSGMPEVWQKEVGENARLGYRLEDWTTVNGLQFPTKLQNLGVEGEQFIFAKIKIGDPNDRLYIPTIQ